MVEALRNEASNAGRKSPSQPRPGTQHGVLLNVVVLVVAILFGCVAMEGALRVMFAHSLDFSMEMWKYAVQLKRPVANPQLSFSHAPNRSAFLMGVPVTINSDGLRDREFSREKPPGVYRVMLLGDSTTFGWGVREEDTAAKFLERKLNEHVPPGYNKVEVMNTGVGNYDTVQEVTYYETIGRTYHPDLVILVFFINDPEPVPVETKGFLIDRSYLIAFTTNRFDGVLRHAGVRPDWKKYYSSLYDNDRPGFQACKNALVSLANSTRNDGAQLLVAILPELHQINGDTYPFRAAHQKIKDALSTQQVPVVELIDGLKDQGPEETLWVTPTDDHPDAKANNLISNQMQQWILANLPKPK
ncbi:MAG: SGNH/GDSL hydrolase family protein [Candidatus Binatia bacterium]